MNAVEHDLYERLIASNDRLVAAIESQTEPKRHPSEAWCTATTKEGKRCIRDAVADDLCKSHWRQANNGAAAKDEPAEADDGKPYTPAHKL